METALGGSFSHVIGFISWKLLQSSDETVILKKCNYAKMVLCLEEKLLIFLL